MTIEKEFLAASFPAQYGKVSWSSPSNIALVKYWGKYGNQLPQNPSLSFTLTNCATSTHLSFKPKERIIRQALFRNFYCLLQGRYDHSN